MKSKCAISDMLLNQPAAIQAAPLLIARHLTKRYSRGRWRFSRNCPVTALEDVSLTLFPGSTLALVGESGSGKTTLAKCIAGVLEPDAGEIWFEGSNLLKLSPDVLRKERHRIQLVFQHSACVMNPRFSAAEVIEEPLRIAGHVSAKARRQYALELMEQVRLPPHWANRPAAHFSGGQKQRLAIARALILKPVLLILDEALSGLDRSTQCRIANLVLELQDSLGLSLLFISHDVRMAAYLANYLTVIHEGRIIESGSVDLIMDPQHDYTRKLLRSAGAQGITDDPLGN